MPRRCDLWRVGIVHAPIETVAREGLDKQVVNWLEPGPHFTFLADPFGIRRADATYLFAEFYDYRTRHGVIDLIRLGRDLVPIGRETVLREPWHLSYPYVFEAEDDIWMLPEAYRSGKLTLYRASPFPIAWKPAATLLLDTPAIDPALFRHDGRWWLFYSASTDKAARLGTLHAAWADELTGEWHIHPENPIRIDRAGARPAGTPFELDGALVLPVQDNSNTYGGGIRLLHVTLLSPTRIEMREGAMLTPPSDFSPFDEGLHTLSACGPITLIDAKRIDRSGRGLLIDLRRMVARPHR